MDKKVSNQNTHDINENFTNFSRSVIAQAEQERDAYIEILNKRKSDALTTIEYEFLTDAYNYISAGMSKIEGHINQEVSKRTLDNRKKLLKRRDDIINEIIDSVKCKIRDFLNTKEYEEYLLNTLKSYADFGGDNCVIKVRSEDINHADKIKSVIHVKEVCTSENISLGGFMLENPDKKVNINETLDDKVLEQKEYFAKISGLKLG